MQLCSKPRGVRGIEPETFRRKGSAFISDHWTVLFLVLFRRQGTCGIILWFDLVSLAQHCFSQLSSAPTVCWIALFVGSCVLLGLFFLLRVAQPYVYAVPTCTTLNSSLTDALQVWQGRPATSERQCPGLSRAS